MKRQAFGYYYHKLCRKKKHFPLSGQLELTYRCSLNCVHCYCKGAENSGQNPKEKELTTAQLKRILDEIHRQGCIHLTLTGGDPLAREDFLEIYSYAKQKGFIIKIFTTGQAFTDETIDFLVKFPPCSIEITLNGATKDTYESITQVKGSYLKAMKAIGLLAKRKLDLILKTNCLKQNKFELGRIKLLSEKILGKPFKKDYYYFKYDTFIYPRLNGDRSVCDFRLSFEELSEARKQDRDIWNQFRKALHSDFPDLERDGDYLYQCSSWMDMFFINPFGRLKFCSFSDKFSVDLKTTPFKKGFYNVFPMLLKEKFKTDSKCRYCGLRPICCWCPAKAYLEMGDEEAPVPYYCQMAKAIAEESKAAREKENKPQLALSR